jgi:NAD(P)-dependent dehydrogenase (short-subunit alcohol dehydrogenase family)
MDLQLKGKKAFISGSTQGIGFAIAKRLLEEGTSVIINGRSEEKVNDAVKRLAETYSGAEISGIAADFSNPADISGVFEKYAEVDILINNVAIFEPKPFLEIPDEDWIRFYEVNVMSGIRLSRFYFPKMIAKNWGRVIFISSESAINIPEEMVHYGMTKTAQLSVSRGLSELTKSTGVTVNAILPGPTASEGVNTFVEDLAKQQNLSRAEMEEAFFKTARPTSLIQRFATPEEIANLVCFVSSPLASAINGASLRVDGGVVKSII